MSRKTRAIVALLAVTVLWGWTFAWMKQALLAGERVLGGPRPWVVAGLYLALRFGVAAALLALVPAARRGLDREAWRGGALLGGLLLAGFFLQMLGLGTVSPAVSAFLTSLYVAFTALAVAIRGAHRVGPALVGGVVLATFGAGFIDGPPQIRFGVGEWLTVGCAFVFAIHILATDAITRRSAPLAVTLVSFVTVAAGSGAILLVLRPGPRTLLSLALDRGFAVPTALSCLLATVVAISLMNLFQRDLDPVRAAIVYALEPVWASIVAIAYGLGTVTPWLVVGGAALLAGNLVAEAGAARASASTPAIPEL